MNKKWIYGIAIVAVLLVGVAVYFSAQHPSTTAIESSGPNVFRGRVVSGNTGSQTYSNVSVLTDEGCTADPRTGLANCTTKLQSNDGVISFNYEHDMMEQPCLSIGDKANMQTFENGTAIVDRTFWSGRGGA